MHRRQIAAEGEEQAMTQAEHTGTAPHQVQRHRQQREAHHLTNQVDAVDRQAKAGNGMQAKHWRQHQSQQQQARDRPGRTIAPVAGKVE